MNFLKGILFTIFYIFRLVLILVIAFFNGLHQILFNHAEIVNIQLVLRLAKDTRDTVAYIDTLCANNADLIAGNMTLPSNAFDETTFMEDSEYADDDDLDDLDDGDDDDDDGPEGVK